MNRLAPLGSLYCIAEDLSLTAECCINHTDIDLTSAQTYHICTHQTQAVPGVGMQGFLGLPLVPGRHLEAWHDVGQALGNIILGVSPGCLEKRRAEGRGCSI